MAKHFFYTREKQVVRKGEDGKAIPKKDETGTLVPGEFETDTVYVDDSFNLDKVIRTHMINEESVVVLLDDGHEVTEKVPELKNPNKAAHPNNIQEVKQRAWVQSEINIKGAEQIAELHAALRAA